MRLMLIPALLGFLTLAGTASAQSVPCGGDFGRFIA